MNDKLATLDQHTEHVAGSSSSLFLGDTPSIEPHGGRAAHVSSTRLPDAAFHGPIVGTLVRIDQGGYPLVYFAGNAAAQPLVARSVAALNPSDVGNEVALMFDGSDPNKPVVLGVIQAPQPMRNCVEPGEHNEDAPPLDAQIDGQRVVLTAEKEIVLRCGKASITLTRAGKTLSRGAFLLSRSSGVNRIKGGSVQIN